MADTTAIYLFKFGKSTKHVNCMYSKENDVFLRIQLTDMNELMAYIFTLYVVLFMCIY